MSKKNEKRRITAFAGRARSGKGELSKLLKEKHGAVIITVANYLKYLCCDILGMEYDELNRLKNDKTVLNLTPDKKWIDILHDRTGIDGECLKSEMCGKTIVDIRYMLQFLGTDVIRKYKPSWHVDCMVEDILSYPSDTLFTVDDMRFPNEKKAIEELGGESFYIVRPTTVRLTSNHPSETALSWTDFDNGHIILNESTVECLKTEFLDLYEGKPHLDEGILLSDVPHYTDMNLKYGIEHEDEELFGIFKESMGKEEYLNGGAFSVTLDTDRLRRAFYGEVLRREFDENAQNTTEYVLYNPIITENFKRYYNA